MVKVHGKHFLYSTIVFYYKYQKETSLNLPNDSDFSKSQTERIVDLIVFTV